MAIPTQVLLFALGGLKEQMNFPPTGRSTKSMDNGLNSAIVLNGVQVLEVGDMNSSRKPCVPKKY